jgi:hypothetical protein
MKVFIDLIKRYETITLEEIQEKWETMGNAITGFGSPSTCTLCHEYMDPVDGCLPCPWVSLTGHTCSGFKNSHTYSDIYDVGNVLDLLTAYRKRAEYMKQVLKLNNIEYESIY